MGNLDYVNNNNKGITESTVRRIIQEELRRSQGGSRFGLNNIPNHIHNGIDAPKINQENIIPSIRASGSITFARTAQYTLGITFNPTSVLFYGVAIDGSGYTFTLDEDVNNTLVGAVYSNNSELFTVVSDVDSGDTTMLTSGTGDPSASGFLTKVSGAGETQIDYSSFSSTGATTIRSFGIGNAQLGATYYFQPATISSVTLGGPVQPFIQSSTTTTTGASGTRVYVSEGTLFTCAYPTNAEANVKGRVTIVGYDSNSIVVDVTVATGWQIIGNYVVT